MKAEEKVIHYIREGLKDEHGESYDKLSEEQQNDLIALVIQEHIEKCGRKSAIADPSRSWKEDRMNRIYTMQDWERDGDFSAVPGQQVEPEIYRFFLNLMPIRPLPKNEITA